jgi:hypothetical protein
MKLKNLDSGYLRTKIKLLIFDLDQRVNDCNKIMLMIDEIKKELDERK